jgi:hypothetical protein
MTSPGGEHISRYRALGEFDNLIRAAHEARRALRELREEEAKLNAQSMADDKKLAASKAERTRSEQQSNAAAKKSVEDLGKNKQVAERSGEDTGRSFTRGMGKGIERESQSGSNSQFLNAATNALKQAFANAGDESGSKFVGSAKARMQKDSTTLVKDSRFEQALQNMRTVAGNAGEDTGNRYVMGFASKIARLNNTLHTIGFDKLDLDVDVEDAQQSMKAVEFELRQLANTTAEPHIRIDANRALTDLRAIQKLFKDEVAEDIVKESKRIQEELEKVDKLPSGKAIKFWALTALSDMSRVFGEAEDGVRVFERLRRAVAAGAGGGGGNNFLRSFISGFDDFSEASSNLLQRLSRVSGELYRMPGLIGVLISAIPALIAGLGALGGGALGLASALGSAAGVMAAVPGLATALIGVVGGLGSTFSGLAQTLKNARQAHEQELEAKEKSRLGTEKALTATQKYNLALRDLDPATQKVTKAIVDFSEEWAKSQKVIGENFFKQVADDTGRLNKLLPIAENFFGRSARAAGKLADEGIRMVTSGPWKRDFRTIAEANEKVIDGMGGAGLHLANAFRNITVAAIPFTTWIVRGLREGAKAFADWSAQARSNGTISRFLGETEQSLQGLWRILKNLGSVVNSLFQSTVDEGQRYLDVLGDITERWADVADAQQAANSPLRQWMTNIRPVLSALGDLIGDLARGIGNLASNQNNLQSMIDLLNTLRVTVLPAVLDILQELNDSGIANTVAQALGDMLQAIADFLESGASNALSVFITVLADFFEVLFNIASLPGISDVLGAVASGLAAIAAVSIVARFTGLFKLWDFFNWMVRNKGNLSGAFADAARSAAGFSTVGGQQALPKNIPSTIGSVGGVGSEVLEAQARATEKVGSASGNAAGRVSVFTRALSGISSTGNIARGALGSLVGFLGGPWGVAFTAAAVGVSLLAGHLAAQKHEAEDTKNAFLALKNAYGDLREGNTDSIQSLADTDKKLREVIEQADKYGISLTDVSGATANQAQSLSRFNTQIDTQIAALTAARDEQIAYARSQGDTTGAFNEGIDAVQKQIDAANAYKNQVNDTAKAQQNQNRILDDAQATTRNYTQRLAGLTTAQVESAVQAGRLDTRIKTLSNALDTMSSATSTAEDRSRALGAIIDDQTKSSIDANEATENFRGRLLDLSETVEANGKSLNTHSRAGLRNRDALEEAAKATRDLYLQDIASGVPMDKALKRHQDRIKELQKEADKAFGTRKETRDLIKAYGDVPDDVKTDITTTGYAKVYQQMQDLKALQAALSEGKSLSEATREVEESKARANAHGYGDGYGIRRATGGPVWGQGTRTSDSIRAWLSNGEFVQPTDAVDYYGMPVMEALRTRKLDKAKIQEALPDDQAVGKFASGGPAHSDNCPACHMGGHKFASGGRVDSNWPYPVDLSDTLVKKSWATGLGGLGSGGGGNGWQWQMAVLRRAFPGLPLISGFRPGARTLSGNRSYHSLGRAVDLPPRRDVAAWIRANYGARTKELITPYNDLNLWNGRPHRYTGAIWNQHNFAGGNAHDHWAFKNGGLVDLMDMMGMQNLAPKQNNAPLPSTPRTLSPAASSVVNNSTDNTRTFGDVIINNPAPERAGDSVRDALYRSMLLY